MGRLKYLLDTNILSEPVKSQPNPFVIDHLRRYAHEIATSSVTWHELLYGMHRMPASRKRSMIERYLHRGVRETVPILPFDTSAAEHHARLRTELTSQGRTPPYADSQIAAIALANDLTLVTRNTADFVSFADLRVENWLLDSISP